MDLKVWQQKFSPLNEVKMTEEFRNKMIETIELGGGMPDKPISKVPFSHKRFWLAPSVGIAFTAVVAVGLFFITNPAQQHMSAPSTPAPAASNTTNTTITNETVAQNETSLPSAPANQSGATNASRNGNASNMANSTDPSNAAGPSNPSGAPAGSSSLLAMNGTNTSEQPNTQGASTAAADAKVPAAQSASPASNPVTTYTSSAVGSSSPHPVSRHNEAVAQPTMSASDSNASESASSMSPANTSNTSSSAFMPMGEGALALFPPQITGTIVAIEPGNPSFATLKDATEVAVPNGPRIHHDSMTIQLPSGGWVGTEHWQSVGNTLDLFIGEQILDLNHESSISGISSNNYQGFIKSVQDNQMVVQLVEFAGTNAQGQSNEVVTDQQVTLNLKPYTTISWEGGRSVSFSALKPQEPVLIVDEGISSYEIARQITVFPDIDSAGWQISK